MKIIKNWFVKLGYTFDGVKTGWKNEKSVREWSALVFVSNILAIFLAQDILTVSIVFAFGFLLVGSELINTAIEAVVDMVTEEIHPLAKIAKDTASAFTFFVLLALVSIWVGILITLIR